MPGIDPSQIRFAQWKDHRLSVHPSRANPSVQQRPLVAPTYAHPYLQYYNTLSAANDEGEVSEEDAAAAKEAKRQRKRERRAKKAGMCKLSPIYVSSSKPSLAVARSRPPRL
jgi:DNA transposition AAA+ family ATPase